MKKTIGLVLCILLVLMSAGCWNKKEPKDLAIINSIIYDRIDGSNCQVIVEFLNLNGADKKNGSSSGENSAIETAQGSTYREALANVSSGIEKTIYGGHNHVRFFTESAANSDMAATLDYFLRDHLTDETSLMIVIKGDQPEKIYQASIGLSDTVGVYIDSMETTQLKTTSKSIKVTTLDFLKDFFNDGKEPVAGVVEVKSLSSSPSSESRSESSEKLLCEGLAAFKDDKLVGYFDGTEARAYNFITGKIGMAVVSVPFGNNYTICEVTDASSDIKTKIVENSASIDIRIKVNFRVVAIGTDKNPSQPNVMSDIEKQFNSFLLPEIAKAVEIAQREFKSDIFGFGASVHAQNPKDWERIKEEWDKIFPAATVNISVESNMFQTGEIKDSVLSEFTED